MHRLHKQVRSNELYKWPCTVVHALIYITYIYTYKHIRAYMQTFTRALVYSLVRIYRLGYTGKDSLEIRK